MITYINPEVLLMMINVTYEELVNLRTNKKLIPGQQYRITDYITTTTQENTRSAGHQFDVIVTADNENTLNEVARACRSEFDIEKYKDAYSSTLGDKMLYIGTQEYEGKEYHLYEAETFNDQMLVDFSHSLETYPGTKNFYPFEYFPSYTRSFDGSDWGVWECGKDCGERIAFKYEEPNYFDPCKLESWQIWYSLDNDAERFAWADTENGKGVIYRMIDEWNNDVPYDFKNIFYETIYSAKLQKYGSFFEASLRRVPENDTELNGQPLFAWKATITDGPSGTETGYSLDESLSDVTLYSISGGNLEVHSTIKDVNVQKGQYTFGQNYDSLCGECHNNTIKFVFIRGIATLPRILFSTTSSNNSFGYNCSNNSLGDYCHNNSFGNDCHNNSLGNDCNNNNFGNNCTYNNFGYNFHNNKFGNNCYNNSFGNNCFTNSFGNNCFNNSLGNYCNYNSFGDDCNYNSFGSSNSSLKSYYRYIIFDNGNSYITLNCTSTTSSSRYFQNIRIGLGVNNTNITKTINDNNVSQTYETYYKPTNSQIITV